MLPPPRTPPRATPTPPNTSRLPGTLSRLRPLWHAIATTPAVAAGRAAAAVSATIPPML